MKIVGTRSWQRLRESLFAGRRVYFIPILAFVIYSLWMIGPYLYSTVIRDASVTAWSHLASAPIFGTLEYMEVAVNSRIPVDGVVARIVNPLASRESLDKADARVARAEEVLFQMRGYLKSLVDLEMARQAQRARYAATYSQLLSAEHTGLQAELAAARDALAAARRKHQRVAEMVAAELASPGDLDDVEMVVADLRLAISGLERQRQGIAVRLSGADKGVYLEPSGQDLDWAGRADFSFDVAQREAQRLVADAESELRVAHASQRAELADYHRRSAADIKLKPNSYFWRELISTGTNVTAGQTVAEYIDCDNLLIDVPLSDAEVSLIYPNDPAEVVLEGERRKRHATVLLTRGAAATLDREDIAALAKSRNDEDVAQVILKLPSTADEFPECPVGLAAYVHFPNVGLIDIVRARLRL